MTKRLKQRLIISSVILFLTLAPLTILYSKGFRLDLTSFRAVRTGGLFFNVNPQSSTIFIDGKKIKKTDFLFGSTLIEGLMPRTYSVEIMKEGFQSWKKNLEITQETVISAKSIHLVPETISLEPLTKNVMASWQLPNSKEIVLQLSTEDGWELHRFDTRTQKDETILTSQNLSTDKILDLHIHQDKILIQTGATSYHLFKNGFGSSKNIELASGQEIVGFSPLNLELLLLKENLGPTYALSEYNHLIREKRAISKSTLAHAVLDDRVVSLSNDGNLVETSKDKESESLSKTPLKILEGEKQLVIYNHSLIFVLQGDNLYRLSSDKIFDKIAEDVTSIELSPSGTKLALINSNEIRVYFINKQTIQPFRQEGDLVFITRLSNTIKNISWWDDFHLIVNSQNHTEGKIIIVETDNRDGAQSWELAKMISSYMTYDPTIQKIYILSEGRLLVSEKI